MSVIINHVDMNGIRIRIAKSVSNNFVIKTIDYSGATFSELKSISIVADKIVAVGNCSTSSYDGLVLMLNDGLDIEYSNKFGGAGTDQMMAVCPSNSSGFIVVGEERSSSNNTQLVISEHSPEGSVNNQMKLNGTKEYEYHSVIPANGGNGYIACGHSYFNGSPRSAFATKYSNTLSSITQRKYEGFDETIIWAVVATSDDTGYILAGHTDTNDTASIERSALILRVNNDLDLIEHVTHGGDSEKYNDVIHDYSNGYVAVGEGFRRGLIVHYDSNLNVITHKEFDNSVGTYFTSVTQDGKGGYIAVGWLNLNSGDKGVIVHYNSVFDVVAQKALSSNDTYDVKFEDITLKDNNIVIVGSETHTYGKKASLIIKTGTEVSGLSGSLVNHNGMTWEDLSFNDTNSTLLASTTSITETSSTITESSAGLVVGPLTPVTTISEN